MNANGFQQLLNRAQSGDQLAMDELLSGIRPYLATIAGKSIDASRASRSASDLVQEVELKVWRHLDQFEGTDNDEESFAMFRTWLVQIVRRLSRDIHRDRNAQKRYPRGGRIVPLDGGADRSGETPASNESTASARLARSEHRQLVHDAIDELLDETERAIVRAYFFEAKSLRAIAEELRIPYHKVKERYRRSLRSLEGRLGEL